MMRALVKKPGVDLWVESSADVDSPLVLASPADRAVISALHVLLEYLDRSSEDLFVLVRWLRCVEPTGRC